MTLLGYSLACLLALVVGFAAGGVFFTRLIARAILTELGEAARQRVSACLKSGLNRKERS